MLTRDQLQDVIAVPPWLWRDLVCPVDKLTVHFAASELTCPAGHRYPVVDGIPVMLVPGAKQTHPAASRSLEEAHNQRRPAKRTDALPQSEGVDEFVQDEIVGTNGRMYKSLVGKLREYPIPTLRLSPANSDRESFLDLGCSWGRWCIAAARLGYRSVGLDPSLEAIRAAYRAARQMGIEAVYLVGDARYLPFRDETFPVVFSYSVLQHFDKADALLALCEAGRVLNAGGTAMIQMANTFGARSIYHQARRGFRRARGFEVRYWCPAEFSSAVSRAMGPVRLSVDGYFTLNPQPSEAHLLPPRFRYVVVVSEFLRAISVKIPSMLYLADSIYATVRKVASAGLREAGRTP